MKPTIKKHKTAEELQAILPSHITVVRTLDVGDHHEIAVRAPTQDMALMALRDAVKQLHPTQVWVGARLSGAQGRDWIGAYVITDRRPPIA